MINLNCLLQKLVEYIEFRRMFTDKTVGLDISFNINMFLYTNSFYVLGVLI